MWATLVWLKISQVSVVSSLGWASARAGLKVRPLISQVVLKRPPIESVHLRSGSLRDVPGPGRQRPQPARHAGPVGQPPRVDPELHQRAGVGSGAVRLASAVPGPAAQLHALPRRRAEVDDHLDPLPRPDHRLAPPHRLRHQAAVGADLDQRRAVGEVEVVGAELGDVEDAQPVALGTDLVVGHVGAVDEDLTSFDAVGGGPQVGEGVGELVVAVEGAVADHQRQVALAAGQRQAGVELVVDDPHPGEAVPDIARRAVEAVVVVPLEGSAFGPAVLHQVIDVGALAAGLDQDVVARLPRREPARDLAVEGLGMRRRQPSRLAVELGAVVAAMEVDGQLSDLGRQFVAEGDRGAVARRATNRRPGKAAAVGPHPRLRPRQGLDLGLPDRDRQMVIAEDRRDRQRRAEGLVPRAARGGVADGQQRARPQAQRQQPRQGRRCPGRRGRLGAPGAVRLRSFQPCC